MITFRIEDMTCGHCAGRISRAIAEVDRTARVEIDIPARSIRVYGIASEAELKEAIRGAGYKAVFMQEHASHDSAPGKGCCCSSRQRPVVDVHQPKDQAKASCCS